MSEVKKSEKAPVTVPPASVGSAVFRMAQFYNALAVRKANEARNQQGSETKTDAEDWGLVENTGP